MCSWCARSLVAWSLIGCAGDAGGDGTSAGGNTEDAGQGPAPQCDEASVGWDSDEGEDGAEGTEFGMGDDMPLATTIFEVQQGAVSASTLVELSGVVVVSPAAFDGAQYEFFVQDPRGGPYSGLRVRTFVAEIGNTLALGDRLEIVGELLQAGNYYLLSVGASEDVVPMGAGEVPPVVVLPVGDLALGNAAARPYDGVRVRVESVEVTDPDPCDGEFVVEDVLRVDDRFVPDALPTLAEGDVLSAVEGMLIYALDSYELAPGEPLAP